MKEHSKIVKCTGSFFTLSRVHILMILIVAIRKRFKFYIHNQKFMKLGYEFSIMNGNLNLF